MPTRERVFDYKNGKAKLPTLNIKKTALFGVDICELKSLELYDKVFADDKFYNRRRKKILIIGYLDGLVKNYKTMFFDVDGKLLENLVFDIFIEKERGGFNFYSSGKTGSGILKSLRLSASLPLLRV